MGVESRQLPLSRHVPPSTRRLALVVYCGLCGCGAALTGALASLLVEGVPLRLVVWLATSAAVAVAAGVVWGRASLIPRPPVERARPRTPRRPAGGARPERRGPGGGRA